MSTGCCASAVQSQVDSEMPNWFCPAGRDVDYEYNDKREIVFSSLSGARLRLALPDDPMMVNQWIVEWSITHNSQDGISGKLTFPRELLLAAFGITNLPIPPCGRDLVLRYSAEFAAQGRFIRDGDYLNIPCAGTGLAGDPNFSIYITDDIRDRVRSFVG